MAQHKIPTFLSREFHSLPQDKRKALLERYHAWLESDITRNLFGFLEQSIEADEATEDKAIFDNEFKSMQDYAWHKGYRTAVRNVTKQLKRDE